MISERKAIEFEVLDGACNPLLSLKSERGESHFLCYRAVLELGNLGRGGQGHGVVSAPGDSENTGELNLSDTLNSRVEVLEGTITIDVGEEVQRFDGVVSSTRSSEVVCGRHWWRFFREIASESIIPLTVMSDVDGSPRSEDGEIARIIDANDVCRAELDLEAGIKSISAHVCQTTRWVIYLSAAEPGVRAGGMGDSEAVFGEGAQDSTGIVEQFQGLVAGVEDGYNDLQVL